jgi:signal transduction histidine kinase
MQPKIGRGPQDDALLEAQEFVTRLQVLAETHRSLLAREIHDELGGLICSAIMDLTSAVHHLQTLSPEVRLRFDRIRTTLETAVDHSRRMVEELRPSILDNFGLFAALQWQLKKSGLPSSAICTNAYPEVEPAFAPDAAIALFRLAQEALAMTFKRGSVTASDLTVRVEHGMLSMTFTDDGVPVRSDGVAEDGAAFALISMRHRLRALGGRVDLVQTAGGASVLTAHIALSALGTVPPAAAHAGAA